MLTFKYNKKADEECWNRLIEAKSMFGMEFPRSFNITEKDIKIAEKKAKEFQNIWDKNCSDFDEGIKRIYNHNFPAEIMCFVNTTPYSMDCYEKRYISVSKDHGKTEEFFLMVVIHEASHFVFRKYYQDFCFSIGCSNKEVEDIKEILTVINNKIFKNINDSGYEVHKDLREKALLMWEKGADLKAIISEIKKII